MVAVAVFLCESKLEKEGLSGFLFNRGLFVHLLDLALPARLLGEQGQAARTIISNIFFLGAIVSEGLLT